MADTPECEVIVLKEEDKPASIVDEKFAAEAEANAANSERLIRERIKANKSVLKTYRITNG